MLESIKTREHESQNVLIDCEQTQMEEADLWSTVIQVLILFTFINVKGGKRSKVMKCADRTEWVSQQIHNREAVKFSWIWLN